MKQDFASEIKEYFSKNKIFLFVFILLVPIFVYAKLTIFHLDYHRTWTDTLSYVSQAVQPITSANFWFGVRPFTLPLVYKIFGLNLVNYVQYQNFSIIVHFQFLVGLIAWLVLAFAISTKFKNAVSKIVSVILIFLLCLGLQNSLWDKLMLSESLSNSLFILLLSLWILTEKIIPSKKTWIRTGFLVFSIIISIFYAFIRDTNAYVLFCAGGCFIIYGFIRKTPKEYKRIALICGFSFVSIFMLSWLNSSMTTRWVYPLVHVLQDRKTSEPALVDYFSENGIDLFEKFPTPLTTSKTGISITSEKSAQDLYLMNTSKKVYLKFLLTHPGYLIAEPFNNLDSLINPISTEYRYSFKVTMPWVNSLSNIIYWNSSWVLLLGILFCAISLKMAAASDRALLWMILFLLLSVIPIALLIWHADTFEIERHAEQIMIQTRLGFWLAGLCSIDDIVTKFGYRKNAKNILSE
ncbi:MAG: hypothetical protein AB9897_04905 [Anaerolineaceae bacterium]